MAPLSCFFRDRNQDVDGVMVVDVPAQGQATGYFAYKLTHIHIFST